MQRLLLIWMLTVLPLVSQAAEPRIVLVRLNNISIADNKVCNTQARVGAKALQNALIGVTLPKQLEVWNAFVDSNRINGLNQFELVENRRVIVFAWRIAEKYPSMTPNDYGDIIYNSCVENKSSKKIRI